MMTVLQGNKYNVPLDLTAVPAVADFIGRQDDLDRLWDHIKPASSQSRKVAVLHGLGGIGKTQLAIRFARMHKKDFTAIFWLSGKDRYALVQSLSSCLPLVQGEHVDMKATTEEEAEGRAIQVLKWLAIPENTDWLLIFDNVDQHSPLQDSKRSGYDISQFFPKADHGSILITSRLQRLTELGKPFPVQKLVVKDATQLLLQSSGLPADNKDIDRDATDLAKRLDGLPLAIVIAGAFMRETGMTVREYLKYYEDSWFNLQSQSGPMHYYQQGNIIETWTVSYREVQNRDPTAAALLLFLACYDNRDIWYELIQSSYNNCTDIPDWLHTAALNELAFKSSLRTLIGFSLIEIKHQEGSYAMHPVIQDWCLHVAATRNQLIRLDELALVSVGYMVPNRDNGNYARLQQRLLPHANYLLGTERCNWADNNPIISGAFRGLGDLFFDQGKPEEAEKMYERALRGYEKALGRGHISTLDTVNNLGILYRHLARLKEAEEMYQRALTGYKKILGPEHTSTLNTVNNLGNLYNLQGRVGEAVEMCQLALMGFERALGPNHATHLPTLNTIINLGNLYSDQGKLEEAKEMYQRALTGLVKALGPDHATNLPTLNTINNLGALYSAQGKLKKAEEMYQRVLIGKEKALGPDHISTLKTINNLGILYERQGRLRKAEEAYQHVLTGYKKAFGPDYVTRLPTLHTLNNLGSLYYDRGKLKEAAEMYQQALTGFEKVLGSDHVKSRIVKKKLVSIASSSTRRDTLQPKAPRRLPVQSVDGQNAVIQEGSTMKGILSKFFGRK
ncbi:hypothetical protein V6Z93_002768 [Aspergillus fumigatus]